VKARQAQRVKNQGESAWLRIVLNEGKNREIRRMLAKLGHKVLRLKRVAIGGVQLGNLKPGKARRLSPTELASLRRAAGVEERGLRIADRGPTIDE
jgi:23S rRNA pseudouridine2605 synthase